jgi:hypothetical protein
MAETNGHAAPFAAEPEAVPPAEFDALLAGTFEPTTFEIAPGKLVEIRPLVLAQADKLYSGELKGADLQRYLLSRSVFVGGRPLGADNVERLPMTLANKLVPAVMRANGMEGFMKAEDDEGGAGTDPKA